jgi:hypothetical protein
LKARFYLPLPDPRNSDANILRTSDWEIPNCFAMREGVIPALKVALTAFTWPNVNAVLGSSGCCRRSDDSLVAIDGSDARSPAPVGLGQVPKGTRQLPCMQDGTCCPPSIQLTDIPPRPMLGVEGALDV